MIFGPGCTDISVRENIISGNGSGSAIPGADIGVASGSGGSMRITICDNQCISTTVQAYGVEMQPGTDSILDSNMLRGNTTASTNIGGAVIVGTNAT